MGCGERKIVLDPFDGSGTSGISAMLLNRKFYGFEIDEKYFEISKARIKCFEDHEKIK